jgi:hypothetical protein
MLSAHESPHVAVSWRQIREAMETLRDLHLARQALWRGRARRLALRARFEEMKHEGWVVAYTLHAITFADGRQVHLVDWLTATADRPPRAELLA